MCRENVLYKIRFYFSEFFFHCISLEPHNRFHEIKHTAYRVTNSFLLVSSKTYHFPIPFFSVVVLKWYLKFTLGVFGTWWIGFFFRKDLWEGHSEGLKSNQSFSWIYVRMLECCRFWIIAFVQIMNFNCSPENLVCSKSVKIIKNISF